MISGEESVLRIEATTKNEDDPWDGFLESVGGNHHLQTSRWASLKAASGWQTLRLVMNRGDKIAGGVQILHRMAPLVGRVGFVSRGPVFADSDPGLSDRLLVELDRAVRAEKFAYLMIQPPAESAHCLEPLRARGFLPTPLQIAPSATVLVDLRPTTTEVLAAMSKSKRRAVRSNVSTELNVRVGGEEDLAAFYSLLTASGKRLSYTPPPLEYYQRMWRLFAPGEHLLLVLAERAGEPVAGELDIAFGDTIVSKRAGWSGRYGRLHPNERVIWAAMNWAKERGFKQYDLEGVDYELASAITREGPAGKSLAKTRDSFKLGFGGRAVVLPENHEYFFGKITGWAHRNVWLRFVPARLRRKLMKKIPFN